MIKENYSKEQIAKITKLSVEIIENLINKMNNSL